MLVEQFNGLRNLPADRQFHRSLQEGIFLALDLADHAYLLETGRVALSGPSDMIKNDESVRKAYLGY